MTLACVLTQLGEIFAPYLDDEDVVKLACTSKQLRQLRTPLLKQIVWAHVGPCENWRAVGRKYFSKHVEPRFSMYHMLSEVVVCDFRAFLWSDVEK